ncbi:MAG TPA: TonB-dependent receptor [Steroidobacter sp.]|uniref:TonB-dependent receptor n=1 Tax=Steroidobacter sp. TaxID=1978227 RepID=UPI002ED82651
MRKTNILITSAIASVLASALAQANTPRQATEHGGSAERVRVAQATQEAPKVNFQIDAPMLARALIQLTEQSGMQLIYPAGDEVADLPARPLRGQYTTEAALEVLLKGTGLEYEFIDARTISIVDPRAKAAAKTSHAAGEANHGVIRLALNDQDAQSASNTNGAAGPSESRRPEAVPKTEEIVLEEVVIVGTLLRNATPTSPVISFHREDIERGGYASVEDVIAKLPQNFSGTNAASSAFGRGNLGATTQIDLRGLGSEATLSLVNGRRIGAAAGDVGRAVDISMIPISAVERIDVLTDGASALYGSDAIGGVVNFILRKDFAGAETKVQYGDNSTGSDDLLASQLWGTNWGTGQILAAAQYVENKSLATRAIGIDTLDFRSRGGSDQRVEFLGTPGTVAPLGIFQGLPFTTLTGPAGMPVFFAALPSGDGRALQLSELGLNQLTLGDLVPEELVPRQENVSGYLTVEQNLGSVTLFADAVVAQRTSRISFYPYADFLVVPETNAFSPFNEPVLSAYMFNELGPLTYDVERNGWFANLGARGRVGAGDWTWELVGTLSEDESTTRNQLIDMAELTRRLASADPAVAFNPFGDGSGQSAGVAEALPELFTNYGESSLQSISAQTQGTLWQVPGGAVRLALGMEFREEELKTTEQRQGAPKRPVVVGSREVSAVFGELYVPLVSEANARLGLHDLAISAAARYEHYSDFGDTVNPKLGVIWRPLTDLALKANWGTSFRAPSLHELSLVSSISPSVQVFDPNAPGGPRTVFTRTINGGNPNLDEETADTYTIAAEYQPDWLEGARVALTYYRTDYDNRIRGISDGLSLAALLQYEASLPPGIVVRAPDGTLQSVTITNVNSATTVISGYDATLGYHWKTQRWGGFDLSTSATLNTKYKDQLIAGAEALELKGLVGNTPDWRGKIQLVWFNGPWSASFSVNHTDGLWNADLDPRIILRDVDSQTTADIQLSFSPRGERKDWWHGLTTRLGATNLFDERPPFVDGSQRRGLDVRNSVIEGRTVYLMLSKGFGAAAQQSAK